MARGLVRMDRESGFCIWGPRQRDTTVPTSESSGSQSSSTVTPEPVPSCASCLWPALALVSGSSSEAPDCRAHLQGHSQNSRQVS